MDAFPVFQQGMNVILVAQLKNSVHIKYVQAIEDWAGNRRSLAIYLLLLRDSPKGTKKPPHRSAPEAYSVFVLGA